MGVKDHKDIEKKRLKTIAGKIMAYLKQNEKYFNPIQLILSHNVKSLLGKFLELLEDEKIKKAEMILYEIETKLVTLIKEKPIK
jgi:hypothetical protein